MKINSKLKWILILLGVIVLGLLFQTREGFNPVTERPSPSDPSLRNTIKNTIGVTDDSDPKIEKYMSAIQSYYDTKFLPEKTSNSTKIAEFVNGQQDAAVDKQKLTRLLSSLFMMADTTGTTGVSSSSTYSYSSTNPRPTCPSSGFLYNDGQAKCTMMTPKPAQGSCPDGSTLENLGQSGEISVCVKTESPTCPSGFTFSMEAGRGVCKQSSSSSTTSSSAPPSSSSSTPPASSSQFSKFAQRVWGPAFVELGQGDGNGNGDSTKTTTYPELLGGLGDRYEGGAGPGEGKIQFPSLDSLGLNANANFFPFSRSPGDMDMIMDPYRVSKSFSAASYSPKPEPAPFLADFSKFQ